MPARAPALDDTLATDLAAAWDGVRRRLRRGARAVVGGEPLRGAHVELLRVVETQPRIGVGEAAGALHLAPNTVSTLVGELVALGLLERRPDPDDRRAARLELTTAAHERIRRFRDERDRLLGAALDELDADDVAALRASVSALEHLLDRLEHLA